MRNFKQVSADQTSDDVRGIDVTAYVASVVDSLTPEIRRSRKTVRMEAGEPLEAIVAPGAIAQIVTNLVLNALRHAFPDGRDGSVAIGVHPGGDNSILLRVADDGIGVSPEIRARMFEPFFTTRRGNGGTGLGLSIVHNLTITTLKGTVTCESSPGKGLTVTIRFPRHIGQEPADESGAIRT